MQIKLIAIGKTDERWVKDGIDKYLGRLKHYCKLEWIELPDVKNRKVLSVEEQKLKEAEMLEKYFLRQQKVYLLDENGRQYASLELAVFIDNYYQASQELIFIIGGPFGFSEGIKKKASGLISFSKGTFSHQMIRIILAEQLYRAFTILKKEPYHHQ